MNVFVPKNHTLTSSPAMPPIDPATLPAPYWFLVLFKIIGFFLHSVAMGLWFAGLPVALLALAFGQCSYSKRLAVRLLAQMPVVLAIGVNFGIVPLLFLQTGYYKPFYTATILTAWHWIAIVPLFLVAYYAVYGCAFQVRTLMETESRTLGPVGRKAVLFGAIASVMLTLIGCLIANGITLMESPHKWVELWEKTNIAGATTGMANNFRDPNVWFHLFSMLGLGMIITAVYSVADSQLFIRTNRVEDIDYRYFVLRFACWCGTVGAVFFDITYLMYIILPLGAAGKTTVSLIPGLFPILLVFIFGAPLAILVTLYSSLAKKSIPPLWLALLIGRCCVLLLCFSTIRQLIQTAKVQPFVDVSRIPTAVQWLPLVSFLLVFIFGIAVIVWMIRQVSMLPPATYTHNRPKK